MRKHISYPINAVVTALMLVLLSVSGTAHSMTFRERGSAENLDQKKIELRASSIERESLERATKERIAELVRLAESRYQQKEYGSSKKLVRQILAIDPKNEKALNLISNISRAERKLRMLRSYDLLKEEAPRMTLSEKKAAIEYLRGRADRYIKKKRYDDAVDELEKIFVLDPLNTETSQKIDAIKKGFLREKKKEMKKKAVAYNEQFADKLEYSLHTVEKLIKEKNYMEAKVILNRMAFVDPDSKKIRKLMKKVKEEESKESPKVTS